MNIRDMSKEEQLNAIKRKMEQSEEYCKRLKEYSFILDNINNSNISSLRNVIDILNEKGINFKLELVIKIED